MFYFKKLSENYYIFPILLFVFIPLLCLPQLFDGISFTYIYKTKNFDSLTLWFSEASRQIHLLAFYIIYLISNYTSISSEIFFDIFSIIFLILFCYEVKLFSKLFFKLDDKWANLAALFTSIFPLWHTLVAINISMYLFSFYFLFFGYRYFISNNKSKILIGFFSLIISFNVESSLCFVIGLAFIHFILNKIDNRNDFAAPKFLLIIIVSFSYYFSREFIFPTHGFWEGYNKVSFNSLISTFTNIETLNNILKYYTYLIFYIWIPTIFFAHLFFINRKKIYFSNFNLKYLRNYYLLIILSGFAIFPYLVANSFIPSILYQADYYQRHIFLLAPIFGVLFSLIFRDINKLNKLQNKVNIIFYLAIFVILNLVLLNYGNYRKAEAFLFKKNLTSELKNYGDIPKGNVELISNNIPVDLRVFEVNHILFSAYNVAGWWGRKEGPPSKYLDNKKYSVTYIFNDYKFDCDISIYLKNDLKKFERFKKFYIFNYKKYYKIDKVLKKC